VLAKSLHGIGTVLVNAQGYALYMFVPDNQRQVTCTSLCAATWPPLKLPASAVLAAGPGVQASLLGSDADPAGGRVVTYNGWPLYTYTGDVQAGQYTGQAIDLNGGDWYLLRPSGKPIEPQPE
jgi:predicted lipoprotein with Yx(FWY)xxD motif